MRHFIIIKFKIQSFVESWAYNEFGVINTVEYTYSKFSLAEHLERVKKDIAWNKINLLREN